MPTCKWCFDIDLCQFTGAAMVDSNHSDPIHRICLELAYDVAVQVTDDNCA